MRRNTVTQPVVNVIKVTTAVLRYAVRRWRWRKFTCVFTPLDGSACVSYGPKNVLTLNTEFTAVRFGRKTLITLSTVDASLTPNSQANFVYFVFLANINIGLQKKMTPWKIGLNEMFNN